MTFNVVLSDSYTQHGHAFLIFVNIRALQIICSSIQTNWQVTVCPLTQAELNIDKPK